MRDADNSLNEILEHLNIIRANTYAYLIVDDLNHLVRGGRLTNGAALIGGLLKIKPVLKFEDGKIVLFEKIRSTKKALRRCEEVIGERKNEINHPVKLYVIHGNHLELAKKKKHAWKKVTLILQWRFTISTSNRYSFRRKSIRLCYMR